MAFLPTLQPTNDFSNLSKNLTITEAANYNQQLHGLCKKFSVPCGKNELLKKYFPWNQGYHPMFAKCVLKDDKKGKKTAVLAGNSFMSRQANAIIKALKASEHGRQFGTIYVLTQAHCPIFESAFDEKNKKKCLGTMKGSLLEFLKNIKPDLFVSLNRLDFLDRYSLPVPSDVKTENETMKLAQDLKSYANFSKTVLIIQPHFVVNT
uniref:SGNH domain-containing protein n=1 Tax=Panagrolaimus sp. JU765 TaxID=591449 RepID=A0AC34RQ77_9BILA